MRIVDRMLLRVLGRSLLGACGALLALGLVVDFLDSARHLLGGRASAWEVGLYYLCKAPVLLYLLLPLALAVAVSAGLASLGRGRELRALAAAGWSPGRLALPALALALACAFGHFALGEWLVPPALDRQERLMAERLGRIDSSWRFFRRHMWAAGDEGRLVRSSAQSADGQRLDGVMALTPAAGGGLAERLDARQLVWSGGGWLAREVELQRFEGGRLVERRQARELALPWSEGPARFRDLSGRPQQHALGALSETAAALEARGLGAAEHRLEWHARFSRPLVGILLVLLLLPFALAPERAHSLARAILLAAGLGALAFFLFAAGQSAVATGALAPALGAWLPAGALGLAALAVWLRQARRGRGRAAEAA
ncbi:MAG TPA: LptF/LptG family permease [Myxococcota bacterium]|nr:LptF/LptG family permease [Myxococcota bacterium]HRY96158.1 LptF/LptG family permease [Myxococcota bacterium]